MEEAGRGPFLFGSVLTERCCAVSGFAPLMGIPRSEGELLCRGVTGPGVTGAGILSAAAPRMLPCFPGKG